MYKALVGFALQEYEKLINDLEDNTSVNTAFPIRSAYIAVSRFITLSSNKLKIYILFNYLFTLGFKMKEVSLLFHLC